MSRFFKYLCASCFAACVMVAPAISGELDGKRALCNVQTSDSKSATEVFLIFSGDNVTELQINVEQRVNSEYEFMYTAVEMNETVSPIYITNKSIFWSKFIDGTINSRDNAIVSSKLLGSTGWWWYIDRHTLAAERGIAFAGQIILRSGECKITDEAGESAFYQNYHDLRNGADEELREKLEAAVSSPAPKL